MNADPAALLAEIEALRRQLSPSLSETTQKELEPATLESDAPLSTPRRWALGSWCPPRSPARQPRLPPSPSH